MAGGLFVLSRDFVHLFLTDKWLPIVPLMQILCLQAIINFINTPADIVFQASGRPAIGTKISMIGVIILAILVYPLSSRWGASGAVTSLFLSVLLTSPVVWYRAVKLIRCTFLEFFKPVVISLISTGVMSFTIITMKRYLVVQISVISFFGLILFGIFVYTAMSFFFDKCANYGIYCLIRERIAVLRQERYR